MLDKVYSHEQVLVALMATGIIFMACVWLSGMAVAYMVNAVLPGLAMSNEWGSLAVVLGWEVWLVWYGGTR